MLRSGVAAIEDKRLSTPRENSAYYYFNQVLLLDAENGAALAGLNQIAEEYVRLARLEILAGDYRQAAKMVKRGLYVAPENEALLALSEEVDALHRNPGDKLKGAFQKLKDSLP